MASPKGHAPYPGCETGGRPLEWTQERIDALRLELEEWMEHPANFWFGDFTLERKIDRRILPKLSRRCEKFRDTYIRAIQNQETRIIKGGLFNITNAQVSIFALKCNHKWIEGIDRSGLDEETETKSTKALDSVLETCIEHANTIQQASDKPSAS